MAISRTKEGNKMAWTLVTGASSGLGAEYCRQLADAGHNVVMVARRREPMEDLATSLRDRCGIETEIICADLAKKDELQRVVERVVATEKSIDLLINNAGFALAQSFIEGDLEREHMALDVMVGAVMVLTHAAVSAMVPRGHGAILNVSSVAAGTAMGTYAAHKTWVNTFTEAVSTELKGTGVTITSVRPGTIDTSFFDIFGMKLSQLPRWIVLTPQQVAEESLRAVSQGKIEVVPSVIYGVIDWLRQKAPRSLVRLVAGHGKKAALRV